MLNKRRSLWKLDYVQPSLRNKKRKIIKVRARNSTITSNMIGSQIHIYNGIRYIPLTVTSKMLGFKFGDFSITRKHKMPKKIKKRSKLKPKTRNK
jgi:small subunit ribosomal protein S19